MKQMQGGAWEIVKSDEYNQSLQNCIAGLFKEQQARNNSRPVPINAEVEAPAREHVSTELKHQLLEKQSRPPTYAVPINTEVDIRTKLGQIMDDKWEDKKRVILKEVDKKIQKEADQRAG